MLPLIYKLDNEQCRLQLLNTIQQGMTQGQWYMVYCFQVDKRNQHFTSKLLLASSSSNLASFPVALVLADVRDFFPCVMVVACAVSKSSCHSREASFFSKSETSALSASFESLEKIKRKSLVNGEIKTYCSKDEGHTIPIESLVG